MKSTSGCTAIFKTGSIKGGQNIDLWAGVSDGNGAIVRQSFNLGTGKLGPAITAKFDKIRFKPTDSVKLSVSANCSGFFQLYSNGTGSENFDFEKDMYRYSYSENKTTDFILAGPECTSYADIVLESKPPYTNSTTYKLVLVFRDGLLQTCDYSLDIYVDAEKPSVFKYEPLGTEVQLNPTVRVEFREPIGYAASSSLKISPAHGTIKLQSINGSIAIFSVTGLESFQEYTAKVSGIKDIAGNEMDEYITEPFTTIKQDFVVADSNDKAEYIAYCGFENSNSTVELIPTFNGAPVNANDVTYQINGSNVEINSNILSVMTHDIKYNSDETVKITARYQNYSAVFTVIIEPWYSVTKAEDFADDGAINNNLNGRFKLMNNIDFGNAKISPIGESNKSFTGIFDGLDNVLSNFEIQVSHDQTGLFAENNSGIIRKLKVINATCIDTNNNTNYNNVGIICGFNQGTIENCHVQNPTLKADSYVGGIAGVSNRTISNCSVNGGTIEATSASGIVGGIVGYNSGNIDNSHNYSTKVTGVKNVGGLIGFVESGSVSEVKIDICSSSGEVNAIDSENNDQYIGGMFGAIKKNEKNIIISFCNSTGKVTASNSKDVGGFVGNWNDGQIASECRSTGIVTAPNSQNVGGFAGSISTSSSNLNILGLYSESDVNVTGAGSNVGGFAGLISNLGNITECHSTGKVTAESSTDVGGLIGKLYGSGKLNLCYHENGAVQGKSNVGGLIGYIFANGKDSVIITGSFAKFTKDNIDDVIGQHEVGGLIGYVYDYSNSDTGFFVIRCYADGEIYLGTDTSNENAGGLIGSYYRHGSPGLVPISECFASGKVTAYQNAGGLIGQTDYCKITNSYSNAEVVATKNVGGLVGYIQTTSYIDYCYAVGTIANSNSSFGGLVGKNNVSSQISRSFRKTGNGHQDNTYGDDKSEINLKEIETYTTNMTNPVWTITSDSSVSGNDYVWIIKTKNGGYPYLANNQPE